MMRSKRLQTLDHQVVQYGQKLNTMDTGMSILISILMSRMQIHVKMGDDGQVDITIFSKSKRNSTQDRLNTHSYVTITVRADRQHNPRRPESYPKPRITGPFAPRTPFAGSQLLKVAGEAIHNPRGRSRTL